nr:Cytochrome P450 [Sitophilus oryzae]
MLTTVLITVLISLLGVWCFTSECRKPICFPPGPVWLPFFGSSLQLKSLSRKFGGQHLALIQLLKKYSSDILGLKLGREYVIAVCSYSTVKKILTSEEYEGRPDNFFFRMRSMGTRKGITGTDGELWKEQRSFLVSHLRALGFGKNIVEDMVKHEICDVISKIDQNLKNVDIAVVLAPSVLNILWHLTSGKDLKGDENIDNLLKLLHKRAKAFDMSGGTLNLYPWIRFIAPEGSGYSLLKKINSEINKFIAETIKEHKNKWRDGQCDDVIYAYLNEMQKKQVKDNNFTDDQLVMVCLDIFLAGSTTTTNTINFAFWSMIMYPEIQEKVHQCLTNAFHDKDISYSDRTLVPYVEAVLLECQRYFPVVPVIGPRRVLRKTSLDNYVIPKDTTVLINIYSVHHDKEYWKDPETFRPERFLDSQGNLQNTERVLTFGLGKRRCLGDALAKSCIFLFFVTILRKYKLESVSQNSKGEKTITGINMTPGNYRVNCTPR